MCGRSECKVKPRTVRESFCEPSTRALIVQYRWHAYKPEHLTIRESTLAAWETTN